MCGFEMLERYAANTFRPRTLSEITSKIEKEYKVGDYIRLYPETTLIWMCGEHIKSWIDMSGLRLNVLNIRGERFRVTGNIYQTFKS